MSHLLAIDVGTSGTKACLHDREGRICGRGYQSHAFRLADSHLAEQDPQDWWQAAVTSTRIALAQAAGHAIVDAIAVSSTNARVLVDEAGLPVRPAILQLDQRATADVTSLADELGADIAGITGNAVAGSGFWLPLLRWLQRHEKESVNQASSLLYPNGYVAQYLSGIASVDRTRAATTVLFDDRSSTWSNRLTDAAGLSPRQLPQVRCATDVLGPLRKDAASLLGICDGIPVIAGAMDSVAGALGLGLLEDGECALMLGTVARAGLLTSPGQSGAGTGTGPHPGIVRCPYPQSPLRWSMSAAWGAGISLQWIADAFYACRWDAIHLPQRPDIIGDLVASVPGPGTSGAVSGIDLTQGLTDIGQASVLAVLADLANHLDRLERACHRQARRVTACGRGARLLAPALASLLGKPVEVPDDPETETQGAPSSPRQDRGYSLMRRWRQKVRQAITAFAGQPQTGAVISGSSGNGSVRQRVRRASRHDSTVPGA